MDDLKRMAVFATVVELGSMTAAARSLGMTASNVSQQVRALEAQSGVPLMHRTTRKLSLTDAGQRFYAQCAVMLQAARQARAELEAEREQPEGELRIAATVGLAVPLGRALAPLLHSHPQLRLQLVLDDAHTDLVAMRIDLAVRLGTLPDSSWVARPLGRLPWWICAAPAHTSRWPCTAMPTHPQQLHNLPWVLRSPGPANAHTLDFTHRSTGEQAQLHISPRIACNQQLGVQQLCSDGLGLAKLFSLDVDAQVANGTLLHLLPDWDCGSLDIWAITPQRHALPARVRMALAALQAHFGPLAR